MKEICKNKRGITLIALVITIIILLILAGVAISSLSESELFEKAKLAKKRTEYAEAKETVELKLMEVHLDCVERGVKYTIVEVAKNIKEDTKITIEKYYNENIASIKTGVTENLVNLEGIVVSVDKYSEYKFLIGKSGEIEGVTTGTIDDTTGKEAFKPEEEFVKEIFKDTDESKLSYEIKSRTETNLEVTVTITNDKGLKEIEFLDEQDEDGNNIIIQCNGAKTISKNCTIKVGEEYKVKITSKGGKEKTETILIEESIEVDKSGASEPNLNKIAQKTYVTWKLNEAGTEYVINDTQATPPTDWYDYDKGKWANIKTTNEEEGLEAYWVWIPRYEYVVPSSETATEIEVKFIPKTKIEPDEGYTIHPAFTNKGNGGFGELDGIWVAKFESSSNTADADTTYGGGDDLNLKVQVRPSVQSWRNITTNNIFTVCRKMTSKGEVLAGSTVDSHMMKNIEWGAVAILSQSKYGIFNSQSSTGVNGDKTYQVWNNSNGYCKYEKIYTGYAGSSPEDSPSKVSTTAPTNVYRYDTVDGTKASTSGTVYGVYDMSGGSGEYVAGCLEDQENSEFGVTLGDRKYVDLYKNSNNSSANYEGSIIGDAIKETRKWNGDAQYFVNSSGAVFCRGR